MVGAGRWAFDGITVPVLDMELAELESSSSSMRGSGGGREVNFVFAKVLARSDMIVNWILDVGAPECLPCNLGNVQGMGTRLHSFGSAILTSDRGDSNCGVAYRLQGRAPCAPS